MIEAVEITKRYGNLTAVDQVSFQIRKGEIAGLLGPNGAGKTTTMRMLTGYMPPTAGEIKIDGRDLLAQPREAKARIGYLPENPPLYPELTVEESLQFAAGLYGMRDTEGRREELLKETGLSEVRRRLIGHLSKGYRQRVGIAQALIHNPDILILDEPTIGLDPKQILEFRDWIRGLKHSKAILLSSHILQEVASLCDRILIIFQGKIATDRSMEGLSLQELESLFLHAVTH